ncbi:MAG: hypothetical protein KBC11_00990 [Candidatus Pacebacteria bacterium]|nr:hypothetical protein [Candidatus Paceibacterota bacterium]
MNQVRITVFQISPEAKALINQYKNRLKERLDNIKFKPVWNSIEEILAKKYGITNIDKKYQDLLLRDINRTRENRQSILSLFDEDLP